MAYTATRRPNTSAPGDGSRTITITPTPAHEDEEEHSSANESIVGTLRLRGAHKSKKTQRVAWSEEVIDNEGCGRKKTKICCIYHKPRRFDESSSEEDSSDSDSDSCDDGRAKPAHRHSHPHSHPRKPDDPSADGSAAQSRPAPEPAQIHELSDDDEPNAYEAMPGSKSKKGKRKAA